jgi:hypothetical protein
MQIQARPHVDVFGEAFPPRVPPRIRAAARRFVARFLLGTIAALVVLWWLQMFAVWTGVLQWAAGLGVQNS